MVAGAATLLWIVGPRCGITTRQEPIAFSLWVYAAVLGVVGRYAWERSWWLGVAAVALFLLYSAQLWSDLQDPWIQKVVFGSKPSVYYGHFVASTVLCALLHWAGHRARIHKAHIQQTGA